MKLMAIIGIQKFVDGYNLFANAFCEETITEESVYDMLEKIFNSDINRIIKAPHVFMNAEELEKFASMFKKTGWMEAALNKSMDILFSE